MCTVLLSGLAIHAPACVKAQEELLLELQNRLKEVNARLYKSEEDNQALQRQISSAEVRRY